VLKIGHLTIWQTSRSILAESSKGLWDALTTNHNKATDCGWLVIQPITPLCLSDILGDDQVSSEAAFSSAITAAVVKPPLDGWMDG